ncbi:MAG: hypothetical protein S4CHLAM45_06770 [Chlamydiales bacterium]|nr:hypothetical protein [Chlamydiales bacterium]MCH9620305.1 hypothetical protein [Chlamydiales bacterium]MCH9622784.1 hypothetical protein [Chlamydiales bacterium]
MLKTLFVLFALLQIPTLEAADASVVCVHGFIRSYRSMIPMGNALKDEGFDVYLWDYPSRRETIEGHAANLVVLLNEIAAKNPGKPIHFVTHSLGGIITKTALNHPDCPMEAKVGRAVLLAPPSKGSCAARAFNKLPPVQCFFGEKAGRQLLTYSSKDMEELGGFPKSVDVLVVAGARGNRILFRRPNDGKVALHETPLETPHRHRIVFAAHNWIMTSRETIHMTKNFLQD